MTESESLRERSLGVVPKETMMNSDNYLCSSPEDLKEPEVFYKRTIVWRNVISMFLLHVAALYGYATMAFNPDIPWWGMALVDFFARFASMGVLAGSHRLWAHRSYKARLPLRIVLMIMHTMSLQNDIYDWCRDHRLELFYILLFTNILISWFLMCCRLHHKHSDSNADPYNAKRGFFFSHMVRYLINFLSFY